MHAQANIACTKQIDIHAMDSRGCFYTECTESKRCVPVYAHMYLSACTHVCASQTEANQRAKGMRPAHRPAYELVVVLKGTTCISVFHALKRDVR